MKNEYYPPSLFLYHKNLNSVLRRNLGYSLISLCLILFSHIGFSQTWGTAVTMTVQNMVQLTSNSFEYQVYVTNTGINSLALRSYSWGLNATPGIINGGTISHTFISRDASLIGFGAISGSFLAATNHFRGTIASNATAGFEVALPIGVPLRIATMRLNNTVPYPNNFNPFLPTTGTAMQLVTAGGKTQFTSTCWVNYVAGGSPLGVNYTINSPLNSLTSTNLNVLTGVITPNPTGASPFILNPPSACVPVITNVSATACNTYTWAAPAGNGNTYTLSGIYSKATPQAGNPTCFDTTYLNLTINNSTSSSQSATACNTYTWSSNNVTYTASGTYSATSLNAAGCIHTTALNLTINNSTSSSSSATACNTYTWSANGVTYTASGAYMATLLNSTGCDSICTLNLMINTGTLGSSSINTCNIYTWSANNQTYTLGGIYTASLLNSFGCDSIHTLNLTIHLNSAHTITESAYPSYTWALTGITYTSTGTYTHTTTNAVGCDSVVTLQLTILQPTVTMTLQNVVQISPSVFEYDVMLNNSGNTALALKGYSCGINHAVGMRGGGIMTHTFISRDQSLAAIPAPVPGYTASTNHLRIAAANAPNGSEINLTPGLPVRIARMRVSNSVPFPADFVPNFTLQTLTEVGKTSCIATCIVTPPGTVFNINGIGNAVAAGSIQGLSGVVNTPCLYLHQTVGFVASMTQTSPVSCYGQSNGTAQISLSGTGALASGIYSFNGGAMIPYSSNPFTVSNLATGTYTIAVTSNNGCASSSSFTITQPSQPNTVSTATACDSYTWNGTTYTTSGSVTNTYANISGCDSIHTETFTIHNSYSTSTSVTACGSYNWNGTTYTAIGTYNQTFTSTSGCDSNLTLNLILNPFPVAYINPTGSTNFCNGNSVALNANSGNTLTYKWRKDGIEIIGATSNSIIVSQPGIYTVEETNTANCSALSSPEVVTVNSCNVDLHLKLFIQGYYVGSSTMAPVLMNETVSADPSVTDSLLIELHSPLPPYGLVLSRPTILHTDGSATCTFNYVNGNYYLADSYYVAVRHRNGLTTWSANPIGFSSPSVQYDFTTASSQAYGDNMLEVEPGVWAFFNGDLNADENLDLLDFPFLEMDINNFAYGYFNTDLNGDGNVDLLDISILEPNVFNFIFSYQPAWSGALPSVSTTAISSITQGTAVSGGNVLSDGGATITARGICWSINPNPTINDTKTINGSGTGSFTSSITSLAASTTYYVRAYVTNGAGTSYGSQVVFTTTALTLPTLTTTAINAITYTTASSGGSISSDGGAPISERGVCWSTSSNPTAALSTKTINGSGTGSFSSSITGLVAGTTYYVRAYATNSVGTSYGNQVVFMTTAPVLATMNTTTISGITVSSAISGGSISSDGGTVVTARGVCWSTSTTPTVALSTKTTDGSGTGSFTSSITSLAASTTYYVRAYATNSLGTAYGSQVVFTTTALAIGQSYQGGIVAYILQSGDPGYDANVPHGIIAAPSDQSTGIVWWNGSYVITGSTATALGTGNANTNTIVSVQGAGSYAAKLCYDLVLNGYSDWYLPSRDELYELYLNKTAIGGFTVDYYWSSSEDNYANVWFLRFDSGDQSIYYKHNPLYVRAVRTF